MSFSFNSKIPVPAQENCAGTGIFLTIALRAYARGYASNEPCSVKFLLLLSGENAKRIRAYRYFSIQKPILQ